MVELSGPPQTDDPEDFCELQTKNKASLRGPQKGTCSNPICISFQSLYPRIPFDLGGFCSDDLAFTRGAGWIYFAEFIDPFLVTDGGLILIRFQR